MTAPGSGSEFDVLVLMNISFLLHVFSISSGGISCIYLTHRDTFLVMFLFIILLETVEKPAFVPGVLYMALLFFCKTL